MWTSDFDCGIETDFWYCIKDTPFDISALKAKRRYEINKGNKNFYTKILTGEEISEQKEKLYEVYLESLLGYPEKQRHADSRENFYSFLESRQRMEEFRLFVTYDRADNTVCGYADVRERERYVPIISLKSRTSKEADNVNFALVYGILDYYKVRLENGEVYLCDGARNLYHETEFQSFLEKYFGFRKAYCKLHVKFRPVFQFLIYFIYPFRRLFKRMDNISVIRKANVILKLEEIRRNQKRADKKSR